MLAITAAVLAVPAPAVLAVPAPALAVPTPASSCPSPPPSGHAYHRRPHVRYTLFMRQFTMYMLIYQVIRISIMKHCDGLQWEIRNMTTASSVYFR